MIYTEQTKKAARIAEKAHHGQTDKGGFPYILHPLHLAMQMDDEDETVVALLHDVLEDTAVSLCDLRKAGFSENVLNALVLLSHDPAVDYLDYIEMVSRSPLAAKVKLADLRHNSDTRRLLRPREKDLDRLETYRRAIALLESRMARAQ